MPVRDRMDPAELDFVEGLLTLIGVHNTTVWWYDFPVDGTCRIGYVAKAGHAMTVNLSLVNQCPKIIGYDVGWPV